VSDQPTPTLRAEDLRSTPNPLAHHYRHFRVDERLLLTGHSHQAWPDVARDGVVEAFDDAALAVDDKWDRAFARADAVRAGYRRLLADPGGEIALGPNTHDLVVKFLSGLDWRRTSRPRLVTTDGEFHSLRRQLARLAEEGVEVVRVPAEPVGTLAERLAATLGGDGDGSRGDDRTLAVLVSAVLFESARIVPHLGDLAAACESAGVELLVDAYHALGCMPFPLPELGLSTAWVTGAGYKYLQLGEGNAFLRLPPHGVDVRPVVTGWFAEFAALAADDRPAEVPYAPGGDRFAGGTYDPTSHYRATRVLGFWEAHGLTPELLRTSYQHQLAVLARAFDDLDLPDEVVTRDRATPLGAVGGFLSLTSPHAGRLRSELHARGVHSDHRGARLRLGPAPYLSDTQLEAAVADLGEVAPR
jgi:kynureninase